jgi:hypothetical protein
MFQHLGDFFRDSSSLKKYNISQRISYFLILKSKPLLTAMRIALHTSVLNWAVHYHKVSISYTTQAVCTVRSVTFSQTVTNTHVFSHSMQSYCALSCVKQYSAQTVQIPTAAVPSGVWHRWIHSLPKLYIATGPEIAVGLGIEPHFETGNGTRISFRSVCALELTDASVGLIRFYRIVCGVTTAWIEQVAWGKITFR